MPDRSTFARLLLTFALAAPAAAQDPTIDKAAIEQQIESVSADKSLAEDVRNSVLEALRTAVADLERASDFDARSEELMRSIAEDPEVTAAIRAELARAPAAPVPPALSGMSAEALRTERDKMRSALVEARDELSGHEAVAETLRTRPDAAREEQARATEQLTETQAALEAKPEEGTPKIRIDARRTRLGARRRALERQLQALEHELVSLPVRLERAIAERDRSQRRVDGLAARIAAFEEAIAVIQQSEAEAAKERAETEKAAAADQHPIVREVAAENLRLTEQLSAAVADQDPATEARIRAESQLARVTEMHKRIAAQLEQAGLRGLSGKLLRGQRGQLSVILGDLNQSQDRWRSRAAKVDADALELYLMQRELEDVEAATEAVLAAAESRLEGDARQVASAEVRKRLVTRVELVAKLDEVYETLLRNLQALETHQTKLRAEVIAFAKLLDEWLLWMPSTTAPGAEWSRQFVESLAWLVGTDRWSRALGGMSPGIHGWWPFAALAFAALVALVLLRRRAHERLAAITAEIRRISLDRIGLTWQALGLVCVLSAPIPLAVGIVAGALWSNDATRALGEGLAAASLVAFVISVIRRVCAPHGIGATHFKWSAAGLACAVRHLGWARWVSIPVVFVVYATSAQPNEAIRNSLGRAGFIVGMVTLCVFWQRLLRPSGDLVGPLLARSPLGWLTRLKWIWYPLAVATPLAFAVLAFFGYYYTALQLDNSLFWTVVLFLTVMLVRAIAIRWLLIEQRRMAVERFRQQRAAETAAATAAGEEGEIALPDDLEVDPSTVNEQTRALVKTASAAAFLIGAWAIWSDVLPALGLLNRVELWAHSATGPDGAEITEWTTLQDVILTFVVLALTVIATRNVPGLLQVVVLKNLPIEASMRYAIVSVVRYVLTIVGVVAAFQILGFNWSSVQWLVAALGVGIGFGLQEIIANFVCGLILLFERPVRIGDSVTIGDTSGTVSRIRIRATTITDWDRKEMVIPNKELITGRVLNWTLSNNLNRMVIAVGVAYGTDTSRVREILVEVAKTHHKVLDDPEPFATFEGFGASSLDFLLRIFLADYEGRLAYASEVRTAIAERFKAEGIEIAFPQLDLHLKSAPAPVRVETGEAGT